MSTALEDSLDDLFDVIELTNQVVAEKGVQRIFTVSILSTAWIR
jgi:uncharacterized protein YqgV (UPF0045/DUF77 family)